jgi:hypothetical protein
MVRELLSKEIKAFIDSNIRTIEDLEILFLVRSDPKHDWDAVEIAHKIGINPILASNHLMSLYLNGLIHHEPEKGCLSHYHYTPYPRSKEKCVRELEEVFQESPSEVVEYIGQNQGCKLWERNITTMDKKIG